MKKVIGSRPFSNLNSALTSWRKVFINDFMSSNAPDECLEYLHKIMENFLYGFMQDTSNGECTSINRKEVEALQVIRELMFAFVNPDNCREKFAEELSNDEYYVETRYDALQIARSYVLRGLLYLTEEDTMINSNDINCLMFLDDLIQESTKCKRIVDNFKVELEEGKELKTVTEQ